MINAKDTPVTIAHFNEFKNELGSKVATIELSVKGLEQRMESRFSKFDSRFLEMESRFTKIDSTLIEMESRFTKIDVTLEKMMELYHRQSVKFEEQTSKNNFVFDHLNMLFERQDKFENDLNQKIKNIQDAVTGL